MAGPVRLNKVAKELGVGVGTITDFLNEKGVECDGRPTSKISGDAHDLLLQEYSTDKEVKEKSQELAQKARFHPMTWLFGPGLDSDLAIWARSGSRPGPEAQV